MTDTEIESESSKATDSSDSQRSKEAALTESVDDEPDLDRALRAGTVFGAVIVLVSYLLPWAEIDGPTLPAEESPVPPEDLIIAGTEEGQLGATDISLFPELTVVIALLAAAIALLRWNSLIQGMTGLLGLTATGIMIYLWAILATDDEVQIAIGERVGFTSSFEPGIGLWVALSGSFIIAICGFLAVVYGYLSER